MEVAMGDPYIFHLERLLLQPLYSKDVFYGNAAQSSLTWWQRETHQTWEMTTIKKKKKCTELDIRCFYL